MLNSILKPTLTLLTCSRSNISTEVLWSSEPKLIGKTHWIGIVYYDLIAKTTFTGYHYHNSNYEPCRPITQWPREDEHPNYNSSDGTYYGLPKTLKTIWENSNQMQSCALLSKEEAIEKLCSLETPTLF